MKYTGNYKIRRVARGDLGWMLFVEVRSVLQGTKWVKFKILDINPGHDARILATMRGTKDFCDKVARFLNIKYKDRRISTTLHWKTVNKFERAFKGKFVYAKQFRELWKL